MFFDSIKYPERKKIYNTFLKFEVSKNVLKKISIFCSRCIPIYGRIDQFRRNFYALLNLYLGKGRLNTRRTIFLDHLNFYVGSGIFIV